MFVNFSIHPSEGWSEELLAVAHKYGEIVDIHFPNIEPAFTSSMVNSLAFPLLKLLKLWGKTLLPISWAR